ncbi:MAG: S8 family peptidase [Bacteroidota bacterium]
MRRIWVLIVGLLFVVQTLPGQAIQGELIVLLQNGIDVEEWLIGYAANDQSHSSTIQLGKTLSSQMNIHLLQNAGNFHDEIKLDPVVIASQPNYIIYKRNREEPDDPFYADQWGLETIMAPEAWSITTGGLTPQGDTIVVAILETGCDYLHEDLNETTWRNYNEIPNDGIDNDNNGFIDDFVGWNFNTNNDEHPLDFHGTSVNGIIGAKGDNTIGVSGVNWSVKRMVLTYNSLLSEVIEGYAYAKMMREMYNQTNGEKGAFIVATNSSFGINEARPDDFPVWCALYDSLGSVGILNAVAAPNMDINVEVIGDMPSRCTSEFVIATTNTDQIDAKVLQAGWGKVSIDLGSPGDNSFTTKPGNIYGSFGGTSSSAPHLAGAISLLYSLPEPEITINSKSKPALVARLMKSLILEGVDPIPSLEDRTRSGGRLNVFNSVALALGLDGRGDALMISDLYPNPSRGAITILIERSSGPISMEITNSAGQLMSRSDYQESSLGFLRIDLALHDLRPGIYFIKLETDAEKQVRKFVIF